LYRSEFGTAPCLIWISLEQIVVRVTLTKTSVSLSRQGLGRSVRTSFPFFSKTTAFINAAFLLLLNLLQFLHPDPHTGVAWHPEVSSWRYGYASHFRSIGKTGTLELLGKKSGIKGLQPLHDHFRLVNAGKSRLCHAVDLTRSEMETEHLV